LKTGAVAEEEAVADGWAAIDGEAAAVGRASDEGAEAAGVGTLADPRTDGGTEEDTVVAPGVPDDPPCQKATTITVPATRTSATRNQLRGSRKPATPSRYRAAVTQRSSDKPRAVMPVGYDIGRSRAPRWP
jgi:hypothetical protein